MYNVNVQYTILTLPVQYFRDPHLEGLDALSDHCPIIYVSLPVCDCVSSQYLASLPVCDCVFSQYLVSLLVCDCAFSQYLASLLVCDCVFSQYLASLLVCDCVL